MATPVSGLSVAVQAVADHLAMALAGLAVVSVDTPFAAQDDAKTNNANYVNLFVYRITPSGFHAAAGAEDPQFIRIHILVTPFVQARAADERDLDLRLLGLVLRTLHSHPVLPVIAAGPLPGAPVADPTTPDFRRGPHTSYRVETVMQSPTMEELNHIWTTQGGDLPYRLSAAYELALIPIEPTTHRAPAGPVTAGVLDVLANMRDRNAPWQAISDESTGVALSTVSQEMAPPVTWLPVQLLVDGATLTNSLDVAAGTASVQVAAAGPVGEQIGITVEWTRNGGATEVQGAQFVTLASALIDNAPAAAITLQNAQSGDVAVLRARPAQANALIPDTPAGNALTLQVTP